jgi:hypothetical protein
MKRSRQGMLGAGPANNRDLLRRRKTEHILDAGADHGLRLGLYT